MPDLLAAGGAASVLLVAPFVGSFLGVLIERLPAGRGWAMGRSMCMGCERKLGPKDLVPVLSYVFRLGRCRCGERALPLFYPAIELGALAVALAVVLAVDPAVIWPSVILGWILLSLAIIDSRHYILPDGLTLPLIPAGLAVSFALDPAALPNHALGAVAGYLCLALVAWVYRRLRGRDGLGLGDAKLLAAAGAWLGTAALPGVILLAACGALIMTMLAAIVGRRLEASTRIAFGPYLASAFWLTWLGGPLQFG